MMQPASNGVAGWVTTKEAARLLPVTPEAVRQRMARNNLPTMKVGHILLVRLSELRLTCNDW